MIDITLNEQTILAILITALSGVVILWLINRSKNRQLTNEITELERQLAVENERAENKDYRLDELNDALRERKKQNQELQNSIEDNKVTIAELSTRLDEERKVSQEKMVLLEQAEKKMMDAFENLSNKILEEKSKKFTEQNKSNIGEVLNPLREQLGDFRKKIEDVYDKETKDRLSLYHEITNLKSLNEQMSKDAINLTKALKGDSKKRGDWGEVILERVLEDSGLKNGREYEVQGSYRDESGKLFYPDVVVHLPNNRDVVIDSKISLNAYERYYAAEDEREKQQALNEHLTSVRTHVNGLKGKSYDELVGVNSLDMVLMFVAIEPALMLAFENDDSLFQDAFTKGIFLVSPSTLTMNLQVIQNMWRYEYQNQNAQEIAKRAGDMYDKFAGFVEALEDVGDKIGKAQSAYDTAHNRLVDGKGNLISRAEAIRKLGDLKTNKKLSTDIVNKSLPES
ncbi:MAG: DNA recombination protein RmuC [Proteobacteria bacterium]|nr:DNA recombination protein RmuC [Pseudomonadota bacterium]NOG59896.1 DNA recombination protein RmuC [Pseudomonadota bacterium]